MRSSLLLPEKYPAIEMMPDVLLVLKDAKRREKHKNDWHSKTRAAPMLNILHLMMSL
jgi:hypothetical protein